MHVLYPHLLRPIPSATIVQLTPCASPWTAYTVPRHADVLTPRVQGVACQFRTAYAVDLVPIRVAQARLELTQSSFHLQRLAPAAAAVLTLELEALEGEPLRALKLRNLRFFLDGEAPLMNLLYELLFFRVQEVRATDGSDNPARTVVLPPGSVRQVGFGPGEELFEDDARTFPGCRLLAEYFAFPEKFMFFEVSGLDQGALEVCGRTLRLQFLLSAYGGTERHLRLIQTLSAAHFKLGCVPVVNLFSQSGAPIRVSHHQMSYPVTAEGMSPGACEIHAIGRVARVVSDAPEAALDVPPFYSIRHGSEGRTAPFYWYATRERTRRRDETGTDVEIALVDLDFQSVRPQGEVLSLQLTCTNRNLPEALPLGGDSYTLPNHSIVTLARPLRKPSPSLGPPAKRGLQWRLISHLSLNHLAMAAQGPQALQEALELYNFTDSAAANRQIQALVGLSAEPATTRLPGKACASFVRGVAVRACLDENGFVGGNLFLFAGVLERFLALSCPPNSFVRFTLSTLQQEGEVAQWPPRTGENSLI